MGCVVGASGHLPLFGDSAGCRAKKGYSTVQRTPDGPGEAARWEGKLTQCTIFMLFLEGSSRPDGTAPHSQKEVVSVGGTTSLRSTIARPLFLAGRSRPPAPKIAPSWEKDWILVPAVPLCISRILGQNPPEGQRPFGFQTALG